jgi:tRNA A-37 threonylcarbamoyl transferase component Bud32
MLVYDLHHLGIAHGDLAPRNVVRTDNREFLLINFTESRMHRSKKCVAQRVCRLVLRGHCIN